jgi:hypothetical protein
MITRRATTWLSFWALVLFGIGAAASAQAAPPTPISACPYTITTSGNYVVTRDLSCGIGINANDVALDLQGHSLTGNGGTSGSGIGGNGNHVIIENGTVQEFDTGISLEGSLNTIKQIIVKDDAGFNNGNTANGIILFANGTTGSVNAVINSVSPQ